MLRNLILLLDRKQKVILSLRELFAASERDGCRVPCSRALAWACLLKAAKSGAMLTSFDVGMLAQSSKAWHPALSPNYQNDGNCRILYSNKPLSPDRFPACCEMEVIALQYRPENNWRANELLNEKT